MVTAQWCLSLSTQRWASVYPSAQRWVWVSSLHMVCDVLYDGPLSQGLLLGATESHWPHWSGHSVHIGHPHCLVFYDAASTHGCPTVGTNTAAILNGSWCTLSTFSGNWSLLRQAVTPMKPGGSITCWTISSSFYGWWGFWLGNLHLWLIRPLSSSHPLPWTLTTRSLFRASW